MNIFSQQILDSRQTLSHNRIIISLQSCKVYFVVSHASILSRQDPQCISNTDTFNETNASITTSYVCIRFVLTINCNRILEAYHIFSSFESRDSRMSMLTSHRIVCNLSVRCNMRTIFSTRSSFDTCKIIMSNRNQVLRFDIATSTNYPSCINLECQACCFVCSPHTNIVNEFVCQATFLIIFVHQIFMTYVFIESQSITAISFTKICIIETTIQRSLIRIDCKCRSSSFFQWLYLNCCIQNIIRYTSFNIWNCITISLHNCIIAFTFIMVIFFQEEIIDRISVSWHCILVFLSFVHISIFQWDCIFCSTQLFDANTFCNIRRYCITIISNFVFNQTECIFTVQYIQQRIFTSTLS